MSPINKHDLEIVSGGTSPALIASNKASFFLNNHMRTNGPEPIPTLDIFQSEAGDGSIDVA